MAVGFDGVNEALLGNDPREAAHAILGDLTLKVTVNFNNAATVSESIIGLSEQPDEDEAHNVLYQIKRTASGRIFYAHENGAGVNNLITFDSVNDPDLSASWTGIICIVRDATAKTVTLYVNGVRYSTKTYANNPTGGTTSRLSIGGDWNGTDVDEDLNGRIGQVAIYNVALNERDAIDLSRGVAPSLIRNADLVSWWPLLDEPGGIYLNDLRDVDGLVTLGTPFGSTWTPQLLQSRDIPFSGGDEPDVKIIQKKNDGDVTARTSFTITFDKLPIKNNFLICAMTTDKATGLIEAPRGWYLIEDIDGGASVNGAVAIRISDGEESSFTWTWATSLDGVNVWFAELEGIIPYGVSNNVNASIQANSGETTVSEIFSGVLNINDAPNHLYTLGFFGIDTVDTSAAAGHSFHKLDDVRNDAGLVVYELSNSGVGNGENVALRVRWTGGVDQALIFLVAMNARGKRKKGGAWVPSRLMQPELLHPNRKPVNRVTVDKRQPFAAGLVGAYLLNDKGPLLENSAFGMLAGTVNNAELISRQYGMQLLYLNGSTMYAKIPSENLPLNDITVLMTFRLSDDTDEMLMGLNKDTNGNQLDFYVNTANGIRWWLAENNTTEPEITDIDTNVVYTVLGSRSGSDNYMLLQNHITGAIQYSAGGANSAAIISDNNPILIGADADDGGEGSLGNYASAWIFDVMIWNRGFAENNAREILKNRYQMFKPHGAIF